MIGRHRCCLIWPGTIKRRWGQGKNISRSLRIPSQKQGWANFPGSHRVEIEICGFLTRRFPMRQIGTFRSLKSDCTKLRHRRRSWVVSKGRVSIFVSFVWFDRFSNFNLWEKHGRPTFWHYPWYSTMPQSCAASSRRPKCANLARAGTRACETVGNRPVK